MATALNLPEGYWNILDTPAYPTAEAARLVRLSRGRVKRWLEGYEFEYETKSQPFIRHSRKKPVIRDSQYRSSAYVSFLDLIDLLLIREFLKQGFSLQELRLLFDEVRERKQIHHLAYETFFTLGKNVFWEMSQGSLMKLSSGGQLALSQLITELGHQIDFDEETKIAIRWFPMHPDRNVVIDPRVSFGHPIISGRRITTSALFDLYNAEKQDAEHVCKWMNISSDQLESAVRFESLLAA